MENITEAVKAKEAEILNMNGIILNESSFVNVRSGLLMGVRKEGNILYYKVQKPTLNGAPEMFEIRANVRSAHYLNTKRSKNKTPFGETTFKQFFTAEKGEMVPQYNFMLYVLCEKETGIGFGVTFKPLIPLTKHVFKAFLRGEKWAPLKNIPFNLGTTQIETKNGNFIVNLGKFNGNSGISVITPKHLKLEIRGKHLGNSVGQMCARLNELLKNEKLQTATTEKEVEEIYETFKSSSM